MKFNGEWNWSNVIAIVLAGGALVAGFVRADSVNQMQDRDIAAVQTILNKIAASQDQIAINNGILTKLVETHDHRLNRLESGR